MTRLSLSVDKQAKTPRVGSVRPVKIRVQLGWVSKQAGLGLDKYGFEGKWVNPARLRQIFQQLATNNSGSQSVPAKGRNIGARCTMRQWSGSEVSGSLTPDLGDSCHIKKCSSSGDKRAGVSAGIGNIRKSFHELKPNIRVSYSSGYLDMFKNAISTKMEVNLGGLNYSALLFVKDS
ncbi:hypothetical protein C5167_023031 [Papaver somniferum]|uniref:Uncharacterized protein n=1 Tax=Papaver somniferum TaxID=3469 RepID=A0A4Y7JL03_PAPSO|nr:hypothetical protein C5167_023031 [Papaver somniferum]